MRKSFRTAAVLALLLISTLASAQFRLPEGSYTLQPGALEIHSPYWSDTYIFGLGWSSGADLPDPVIIGQGVSVSGAVLDLVTGKATEPPVAPARPDPFATPAVREPAPAPRPPAALPATPLSGTITGVRFGGTGDVRIVLDISGLTNAAPLQALARSGSLQAGETLTIPLAGLTPPERRSLTELGVHVEFSGGEARVTPGGSGAAYSVFALADPARLVIDLTPAEGVFSLPDEIAAPVAIGERRVRQMSPGITYQQFDYPNGRNTSAVHVLEISPGAGRLGVVGQSRSAAPLSELARGSLAAINAGYFNTSTHDHIGLLLVDDHIDTLPSLGRASIGFNGSQAFMARTRAEITVRAGASRVSADAGRLGIEISETPGARVGDRSRGVLLVEDGVVTANRLGPLTVPEGGYGLAYNPELRELALLEPGERVSYTLNFHPAFFDTVSNAVEAGPLLVDGGQPAFRPELETFARGQRILDEYTSQSAIGIRPDGTVLFVVADTMRALDLVPLFQSLGAGQAMRLDSGGSAALYAGGSMLNRNVQRRIVSAIVVLPH